MKQISTNFKTRKGQASIHSIGWTNTFDICPVSMCFWAETVPHLLSCLELFCTWVLVLQNKLAHLKQEKGKHQESPQCTPTRT